MDANMDLIVYVPDLGDGEGVRFARELAPGSGVVGTVARYAAVPASEVFASGDLTAEHHLSARRTVYYEGNVHGASNIVSYADRVYHAADRLVRRYPTIARRTVHRDALIAVGTFDYPTRTLRVSDEPALAAWLALVNRPIPASELEVSK